jgi:hypothetical protein
VAAIALYIGRKARDFFFIALAEIYRIIRAHISIQDLLLRHMTLSGKLCANFTTMHFPLFPIFAAGQ